MQMMVIVFNKLLEESVLQILEKQEVHAFTETPRVLGAGEAGRLEDSRHRPGYNVCIFAVLAPDQVSRLTQALKDFGDFYQREYGRVAGLRAFTLPCEQAV